MKNFNNKTQYSIILLCLVLLSNILTAQDLNKPIEEDLRQLLLDKLDLTDMVSESMGQSKSNPQLSDLRNKIENMSIEEIGLLTRHMDYQQLRLTTDDLLTTAYKNKDINTSNKVIDFFKPDPSFGCDNVDPGDVILALANKFVSAEIVSAAKWACLETVFGENAAATCIAFQVIAFVDKGLFEVGEHCLKDQNSAVNTAMFSTVDSIGTNLNDFVDATISSRATEESAQNVEDSVDSANSNMGDYFPVLDSNLTTALVNLDFANDQINNIHSQADSLLFRVQVDQIEIETIEVTTSDIQQRAEEIRDDTQSLILNMKTLLTSMTGLNKQSESMVDDIISEQIEFVLARPTTKAPLSFQIPASHGGQLEQVRELIITQLNSVAVFGADVSKVQASIRTGDDYYNSGQFKNAYTNYSTAYQTLLGVSF